MLKTQERAPSQSKYFNTTLVFKEVIRDLKYDGDFSYKALSDGLCRHIDALYGSDSEVQAKNEEEFPTRACFARNAKDIQSFAQKEMKPTKLDIEADNVLLRMLSITRAIDHVCKGKPEQLQLRTNLLILFKKQLEEVRKLVGDQLVNPNPQEKLAALKKLEKNYHRLLAAFLAASGLAEGLKTTQEFEALLDHYRICSSLLDPAPAMETITRDKDRQLAYIKTSYPITQKTQAQKDALDSMVKPDEDAATDPFNIINKAFVVLAKDDTRCLSPQKRHRIGPTLGNGWLEKEAFWDETTDAVISTRWTLRSGSPTYVGKVDDATRLLYAKQNLEQIELAIQQIGGLRGNAALLGIRTIYITQLVTDMYTNYYNERTMRQYTQKACEQHNTQAAQNPGDAVGNAAPQQPNPGIQFHSIYAPANHYGTFHTIELPATLAGIDPELTKATKNRKQRHENIVAILEQAATQPNTLVLVSCASGQNRTNAVINGVTMKHTEQVYATLKDAASKTVEEEKRPGNIPAARKEFSQADLENTAFKALHEYWINTLTAPGSPGGKSKSKPTDYLSKEANEFLYPPSAYTNQKPPIGHKPFYKRWQFWLAALTVVLSLGLMATGFGAFAAPLILTTVLSALSCSLGIHLLNSAQHDPKPLLGWKFWLGLTLLTAGLAGLALCIGAVFWPAAADAFSSMATSITTGITALGFNMAAGAIGTVTLAASINPLYRNAQTFEIEEATAELCDILGIGVSKAPKPPKQNPPDMDSSNHDDHDPDDDDPSFDDSATETQSQESSASSRRTNSFSSSSSSSSIGNNRYAATANFGKGKPGKTQDTPKPAPANTSNPNSNQMNL